DILASNAYALVMCNISFDAACQDYVRTHDLVIDLAGRVISVIYIGQRGHPEPEGVIGEAPDRVYLVEPLDLEALDQLKRAMPGGPIAVTCQTTLSQWDTLATIEEVRKRWPEVEVHNE